MNPLGRFQKNLLELQKFCVVESENIDAAGGVKRLRCGAIVHDYIKKKIDPKMKEYMLEISCTHIRDLLIQAKKRYSEKIVQCKSQAEVDKVVQALADEIKVHEQ